MSLIERALQSVAEFRVVNGNKIAFVLFGKLAFVREKHLGKALWQTKITTKFRLSKLSLPSKFNTMPAEADSPKQPVGWVDWMVDERTDLAIVFFKRWAVVKYRYSLLFYKVDDLFEHRYILMSND